MIKYLEHLQTLRQGAMDELQKIISLHDTLNLIDFDDEDKEWLNDPPPRITVHHKHYCYSEEYVTQVYSNEGEIKILTHEPETGGDNRYNIDVLDTIELCELVDYLNEKVI